MTTQIPIFATLPITAVAVDRQAAVQGGLSFDFAAFFEANGGTLKGQAAPVLEAETDQSGGHDGQELPEEKGDSLVPGDPDIIVAEHIALAQPLDNTKLDDDGGFLTVPSHPEIPPATSKAHDGGVAQTFAAILPSERPQTEDVRPPIEKAGLPDPVDPTIKVHKPDGTGTRDVIQKVSNSPDTPSMTSVPVAENPARIAPAAPASAMDVLVKGPEKSFENKSMRAFEARFEANIRKDNPPSNSAPSSRDLPMQDHVRQAAAIGNHNPANGRAPLVPTEMATIPSDGARPREITRFETPGQSSQSAPPVTASAGPPQPQSANTQPAFAQPTQQDMQKSPRSERAERAVGAQRLDGFPARAQVAQESVAARPAGTVITQAATTMVKSENGNIVNPVELARLDVDLSSGITQSERAHVTASTPQPVHPAQVSADQARHIANQLAAAITRTTEGVTEVRLNPEELGRVRMTLSGNEGIMNVVILADRPETHDLLRRHIDQLAQEFRALGYQTTNFSFGGNGSQAGQSMPSADGQLAEQEMPAEITATPAAPAQTTGLDLRL